MIQKLRIQIVLTISAVSTVMMVIFLTTTYLSTKNNMESNCYSDMSYILSDITTAEESTYPIAVVTVNYSGKCTLLLDHLYTNRKDEILSIASSVLKRSSSSGELDGNIRYVRKSIGYSNIRIALVDISSEKQLLSTQLRNYIASGAAAFIAFLFLGIAISKLISIPVEKAMIAQKQFIANASHELKTPLTVILSNLDMLETQNLTAKDQIRTDNIKAEAVRMRDLVINMLQIARYDSALLPIEHVTLNLSYIVQCGISIYEPLAFDKNLTLSSDIQTDISVSGNEQRLQQLVSILLDNALKYCVAGGSIHVNLSMHSPRSSQLSVSSSGNLIAREELDKIFTNFYRSPSSASNAEGNGLGLSIAAKIVEDLNGKIWAESNSTERMNTFYVRFKSTRDFL